SPRYNIKIDNQGGATPEVALDFGGGPLGSAGENCIVGAGVQGNGYTVFMHGNWWGSADGPAAGSVSAQGGSVDYLPVLMAPPPACP
ncbi:MAG: hypothetical protein ACRETE_07435, partial [Stenotrophobium sp.]